MVEEKDIAGPQPKQSGRNLEENEYHQRKSPSVVPDSEEEAE